MKSRNLPPSEAQPEAAEERVEYSVVEKRFRKATGWNTTFALPSLTSWFRVSPLTCWNCLQTGQR